MRYTNLLKNSTYSTLKYSFIKCYLGLTISLLFISVSSFARQSYLVSHTTVECRSDIISSGRTTSTGCFGLSGNTLTSSGANGIIINGVVTTLNWESGPFFCGLNGCPNGDPTQSISDARFVGPGFSMGTFNPSVVRPTNAGGVVTGPSLTFKVKPRVAITNTLSSSNLCGNEGLTLTATTGWTTMSLYHWYYTLGDGTTNDEWVEITSLSGNSVSVSIDDFGADASLVFDKEIKIGVGIGNDACTRCTPNNMEGNASTPNVKFQAPIPDVVSGNPMAPECRDGEGSFQIVHDVGSANTTFVYTVTQLIYSETAMCDALDEDFGLPMNINSTTLGTILGSPTGTLGDYESGDSFCEGFIGNFLFKVETSSLDGRTVTLNANTSDTIPKEGTPNINDLKMFPGVYKLDIEAQGKISCIGTYFFQVPQSPYENLTLNIPSQDNIPACEGSNDGSLEITLEKGLEDFTWTLSGGASPITDVSSNRIIP